MTAEENKKGKLRNTGHRQEKALFQNKLHKKEALKLGD